MSAIRSAKSHHYRRLIVNARGDSGRLWRYLGELTGNSYSKNGSVQLIEVNHERITDKNDIVDLFASHFSQIAEELVCTQKWKSEEPYEPSDRLKQFAAVWLQNSERFCIPNITPCEVKKYILGLKKTKSTGIDEISTMYFRIAANAIAEPLCEILNRSITECRFPSAWKTAKVVPVHKCSARSDMNN